MNIAAAHGQSLHHITCVCVRGRAGAAAGKKSKEEMKTNNE